MDSNKFTDLVKQCIVDDVNERFGSNRITPDDVYIVWLSKVLQNNKALASTPVLNSPYYEITYDGDKHAVYIDTYQRTANREASYCGTYDVD